MSLKHVSLAPQTLAALYKGPLFASEAIENKSITKDPAAVRFLGSNNKKITVLVKEPEGSFLPDQAFNFLTGILSACKLTVADIALVNVLKLQNTHYQFIESQTKPQFVLLFNVPCAEIGLPIQIPDFQVHKYNGISYLSAPDLQAIAPDKAVKAQLWICLKSMFNL